MKERYHFSPCITICCSALGILCLFCSTYVHRFREEARVSEARFIALASALKTEAAASAALAAAEDHQLHGGNDRVHIMSVQKIHSSSAKWADVRGCSAESQEGIELLRRALQRLIHQP